MNQENNNKQAGNPGDAQSPMGEQGNGFLLPPHLNQEIATATDSIQNLIGVNARLQQLYNIAYSELLIKTDNLVVANAKIEALILENRQLNEKLKKE